MARSRWWLDGVRQVVTWLRQRSLTAVWRILQRLGLRYRRGRQYLHSPDPDYDLKMAYVQAALNLARTQPDRYVMLYHDEMTYAQRPTVAQSYAPQGSKLPLAVLGHRANRKRRIAASLNAVTGQLFAWQRWRFDRYALRAYFLALEAAYPDAEWIFVALDNWSVHFHPDLLLALAHRRIVLLRLPTYAPWTNPTEKVWLALYREILHLHAYVDDRPGLQTQVQTWLDRFAHGSLDLLHTVGLYPY